MVRHFFATLFLCLSICAIVSSCQEEKPKEKPSLDQEFPEQTTQDTRLNLNDYIRYKKIHQWGDSLYFLVMSWGSDSIGSYSILLADSANGNYTSFSMHQQGSVVQTWINDFDRDSLPEIGIVTRSQNQRKTGQMRLHELGRNSAFETIDMQPLSEQLGADYEGGDIFYPQTGQIVREFRTVNFDTAVQDKTVKRIVYELDNNQLIVTEFESTEDSQ
ncbi:PliI family lysozyme inhibitor of I-type lysozyme [Cesiribacter sp. SM1]|uniref:PliI family lysozyme inhibitor of I-type lysozyme n=1 Tax=Cesiribacter sp. SM1 TaxID=2861196 RepID=UPI001CD3AC50|nr:PliI family lysozyme inhibitor of I-type lysozyme [Cesiribacter sp. SM1]